MKPFVSKNNFKNLSDNQYNKTRKIFKNKFPYSNKNIHFNINNQRNWNNIFNNNPSNNKKTKKIILNKMVKIFTIIIKFQNIQIIKLFPMKMKIVINWIKIQTKKNFMISKSFHNINDHLKYNIPKNSNIMNNMRCNKNLYNINYNNK